eukprot:4971205-Alexandrium_andersonii.AAC.1
MPQPTPPRTPPTPACARWSPWPPCPARCLETIDFCEVGAAEGSAELRLQHHGPHALLLVFGRRTCRPRYRACYVEAPGCGPLR